MNELCTSIKMWYLTRLFLKYYFNHPYKFETDLPPIFIVYILCNYLFLITMNFFTIMIAKIYQIWAYEFIWILSTVQTLANWGPNSRFILEAIIKALIFKSILITLNGVHSNHNSQPDSNLSDYLNFLTCLQKYLCKHLFGLKLSLF